MSARTTRRVRLGVSTGASALVFVLASTDCSQCDQEPCVEGLSSGQRLTVTIVDYRDPSLPGSPDPSGSRACTDALGLGPGTRLTFVTGRSVALREGCCRGLLVDLEGTTKITVGRESGGTTKDVIGGSYQATGGCSATLDLEVIIHQAGPIRLPVRATPGVEPPTMSFGFREQPGTMGCPVSGCLASVTIEIEREK